MVINWDSDILEYCAVKQDIMLRQLDDNVRKRGDTKKNDDEVKACEIIRVLCKKGLLAQSSALYGGISGSELSTGINGVLTKNKKRQVLRKAQILITETNELFGKLNNKLAKELVEIHLTDLR